MALYIATGFVVCLFFFIFVGERPKGLRVEVGQSHEGKKPLQHTVSARIRQADGSCLHFERIDLREEDWEEQLAVATAKMKQKVRALEAAQQIAGARE